MSLEIESKPRFIGGSGTSGSPFLIQIKSNERYLRWVGDSFCVLCATTTDAASTNGLYLAFEAPMTIDFNDTKYRMESVINLYMVNSGSFVVS